MVPPARCHAIIGGMLKLTILALSLLFVLTACGSDSDSATATTPTLSVGSTAWAPDGSTLTLRTVERPATNVGALGAAVAGTEWLALDVEECAGNRVPADQPLRPFDGDFDLIMADNTRIGRATTAIKQPHFGTDSVLASGECLRGWVTFRVPVGAAAQTVVFDGNASTPREWHATFVLTK